MPKTEDAAITLKETLQIGTFFLVFFITVLMLWITQPVNNIVYTDNDGDGYTGTEDCNDNDRTINIDAEDIAGDGIDQNCDGVDELISFNPNEQEQEQLDQKFAIFNNLGTLSKVDIYIDDVSPKSNFITPDVIYSISKKITLKGKDNFENIYLFIEASVGENNPLSKKDSIYFYIYDGLHGGHIVRKDSIPIPLESNINSTKILFSLMDNMDLTSIPYNHDNPKLVRSDINFYRDIFKKYLIDRFFIGAFVSTGDVYGTGVINKLTIYYSCKAQTECSIVATP